MSSHKQEEWTYAVGCPKKRIWGDNGTEFANKEMAKLCKKWDIQFSAGPPYSQWSNGYNKRNHHSSDKIVKKLLMENPKMTVQSAINKAAWVHNTNISVAGFASLMIAAGQGSKISTYGVGKLEEKDEEMTAGEQIEKVLKKQRIFMEAEAEKMVQELFQKNQMK